MCRTSSLLVAIALVLGSSSLALAKSPAETKPAETKPKVPEAKPKVAAAKQARKKKVEAPCYAPMVHVVRKRGDEIETRELSLTMCDGAPNASAVDSLSVLARPRNVERPFMPEIKAYRRRSVDKGPAARRRKPDYLSENVLKVHPGLAVRLQKIADRFPGKTIEIISGHRPDARDTSRHHHGRALDVHVVGVTREKLRDFLRTLDQTGVGYYPNGYFVHVDVRDDRGYWIDRSGPGEVADYGPWPPRPQEIDKARKNVLASAMAELGALREAIEPSDKAMEDARARLDAPPPVERPVQEGEDEDMSADEVARIKADALKALEQL